MTSTEVVDEFTVAIHLTDPFGPLMANLSHSATAPISPTAAEEGRERICAATRWHGPVHVREVGGQRPPSGPLPRLQLAAGRDGPHWAGATWKALFIRKSPSQRPG